MSLILKLIIKRYVVIAVTIFFCFSVWVLRCTWYFRNYNFICLLCVSCLLIIHILCSVQNIASTVLFRVRLGDMNSINFFCIMEQFYSLPLNYFRIFSWL